MSAESEPTQENATVYPGASELVELPSRGRVFTTSRRVSIDDAAPSGRMESDAIARFLQDAGNDDTDDAGLDEFGLAWVARRATIEVAVAASARELLDISTWCSGTGRRWAERRTRLRGDSGAEIDAAAVWIHIDTATGRPAEWGDSFSDNYLTAAQGRHIGARLHHDQVPVEGVGSLPWRFRSTDMDAFGHVNNAAYLAIGEQCWGQSTLDDPHRIEIEWRKPSTADEELEVLYSANQIWLIEPKSKELRVTITCRALDRQPLDQRP